MKPPHFILKARLFDIFFTALAAFVLFGCARNKAPKIETTPPAPVEATPTAQPQPTGPLAGSVWDVVTPDGLLPKDLLQAMAGQGAETSPEQSASWHTWSVDINGDGSKELFVSNVPGWCGSGGCSVWLWQRTPEGLRNLLPTESTLTLAVELSEAGLEGYRDILFYHRAMQSSAKQSLAQEQLQWDGQSYQIHAKIFLGDYLHTLIPEGAWGVIK